MDAGRRPKPVRVREANTRILRANFRLETDAMFIEFQLASPSINGSPTRGESNSVQGAGVKKTPQQRRVGRAFPTAAQTENPSRNIGSEWDAFSGWVVGGKFIPESALRTGHAFPMAVQAENSSRNPASNWDALSAPSSQLQNLCALHSKTG